MIEINADEPTPELLAWFTDHGLNPHDIKKRPVLRDEEGRIHLRRLLRRDGKHYLVGEELASEPVIVEPKRPMPCPVRE